MDVLAPALTPETDPQDQRAFGARLKVTWEGGEQVVTIDKPLTEPGANFPMWKWQVCAIQALGMPDEELPSDRVIGLHAGHPDEASGNTLFHHSFIVTYVKTRVTQVTYSDSVIYGVVRGGAGRTVALVSGNDTVTSQTLPSYGVFRFAGLTAGEYSVVIEGTTLRSAPVKVDGRSQVSINMVLPMAQSVITGQVRKGAGQKVQLTCDAMTIATAIVAADENYRFSGLTAGAYRVALSDTQVISEVVTLDGANSATADLIAPTAGKPLAHYILFGPAGYPATTASLLLTIDYLLAFGPSFGFSVAEAFNAGIVTIIGGPDAVKSDVEVGLRAGGAIVQRITGAPADVAAALAAHIASGRPF
jgi:hypothetical protein